MKRFKCSVLVYLFLIFDSGSPFNIIGVNKQMLYDYVGSVTVGAKSPQDDDNPPPASSGWQVRGKLTLQRQNEATMAAALSIDEVSLNNSGEKYQQNKEMYSPYKPFKIALTPEGTISHLHFKLDDPIWSTNFKRSMASILQFQLKSGGAFVIDETGIHGKCSTEYFVSNRSNHLTIRKTPELKTCKPFPEAIHMNCSNVPPNVCEFDFQKSVISGNEAIYGMLPHPETEYYLNMAHVKGTTLIHTFESTGEAQYINSELLLNFLNETNITNPIDIETNMAPAISGLELVAVDQDDPTGGRHPQLQEALIANAAALLNALAEGLENFVLNFDEPYDSTLSDIIKLLSQMSFESLQKLYTEVDIGTSYRQETIRNIFYEIIPRIGTAASVRLTRYLVMMDKGPKSTTVVEMLISLPFHIHELSYDLVKECEIFLTLGPERLDVQHAAILSFSTLVYHVFAAGKMPSDVFEEYVQRYFNHYLNAHDYEQKMLYLQGMSNLQLGNVANYLDPIIKEENENVDLKFLASWAIMSTAHRRPDKIYEIYWPIFESKNSTLEMRVAALTLLLISNPTPARLISVHRMIQDETDPHMINYYRTTIKSISETTYPCYQLLRRLLSYMNRHLPPAPEARYWVTGNYIFDYRDAKYGIGAMLQAFMIGDRKSDLPVVAYLKFDTEALGKFTGQLAVYIKARGLPDGLLDKTLQMKQGKITLNIIKDILLGLNAPTVDYTPLHLEFILQMEGKTVLSYYSDQKTFKNLTIVDVIHRLSFLLGTDSHINMQFVRWPFMTKYSVPTVVGTTADVLLQTTALTSIRGNITRHEVKKTHQIDARYYSYASCKSRSYNPFLNLDHEINREQGFLVYIPFSNELRSYDMKCLQYSFSRQENLTSGLSFKSRSVTSTKGLITKSSTQPFNEVILPERSNDVYQLFKYDSEDLGISMTVNTNLNELNKYRVMLLKSEFMENGFSKNLVINIMMYMFGMAQLSSIHLGHDRNFTLLIYNENSTKIEGSSCTSEIDHKPDQAGQKLSFTLTHTNDLDSHDHLHKWDVTMNFESDEKTNWYKVLGSVKRSSHITPNVWAACMDLTYAPMVFSKRPHTMTASFTFGNTTAEQGCPTDSSKVVLQTRAGPSQEITSNFFQNTTDDDSDLCPRKVLRFRPMPETKFCKRNTFDHLTSIAKYDVDIKFSEMPEWFDSWSHRLDHFVSALSDEKIHRLNLRKELDLSIKTPSDQFWLSVDINGVSCKIYQIPFLQKFDSKFDTTLERIAYDTGFIRSCSVIKNVINTFDDYTVNITDYLNNNSNQICTTLLAAECSMQPKMAIFLDPSYDESDELQYGLKVYVANNYFTFEPQNITETGAVFITVNGSERVDIRKEPYKYPAEDKSFEFRVEINEQNILVVQNDEMKSTIQFDMLDTINIEIIGVYKNKMCGLCSQTSEDKQNYSLCYKKF